jgi:hypothetical protein
MFKFWQCIKSIYYDPRVNRKYGDGQWCIQECWAIYFLRRMELLELEEWEEELSHGRSTI